MYGIVWQAEYRRKWEHFERQERRRLKRGIGSCGKETPLDPESNEIDLERDNHGGDGKENGWIVHP